MSSWRRISLIVAGVDVALVIAALAVKGGNAVEAIMALFFMLWGLACVWFSEKVANFANHARVGWRWPKTYEPNLFLVVGWGIITIVAPMMAVLAIFDM